MNKRHSYKVPKKRGAEKASEATSYDEAEIARLVERAAGGDFEAFGELYNIHLDRIYRYVFYQVKDKMTAEDLIEEIFVKAWKAIGSYRGKGQAFSSWLYRIAHNYLVDYFRKSQKRKFLDMERRSLEMETAATVASPEQESERKAVRQELMEAISYLRDNQRQVILLKFVEGLDNREIGEIMGKSQGAVRILQMRALATLRKRLSSEE
jgi:RNA polymerase sigma-70 factor (ECF subfamily)